MAAKIKFENAQRLLQAASNTINDLLKENYELKKQVHELITSNQYENTSIRRTMDLSN